MHLRRLDLIPQIACNLWYKRHRRRLPRKGRGGRDIKWRSGSRLRRNRLRCHSIITVLQLLYHAEQMPVAFFFHFLFWNKPKRGAVDAVPPSARPQGPVVKHMPEMGVARAASYLGACHAIGVIVPSPERRRASRVLKSWASRSRNRTCRKRQKAVPPW